MGAKLYNFLEERTKRRPQEPEPWEDHFMRTSGEQLARQIDNDVLSAIFHQGPTIVGSKEETEIVP